jgi:Chaperone of endosialidase/Secretion system C-terminal sorting domain
MKKTLAGFMVIAILMASNLSYCQWTAPNAIGNINNTNAGSVVLTGTLDQANFNPSGVPLEPGTAANRPAQVNANFGGLIFHSNSNTPTVMNNFWGQNFDFHNPSDIRYRINGPATLMQFLNGNMYFYTGVSGTAGQIIPNFAFLPKISLANNGGFAIGTAYAINNTSAQGTLVVQNNIGIGIQSPAAQLHTTGSVRFAGLTNGGTPNNIVSIDANGNLWRSALPSAGVQNLCANVNFLTKSTNNGNISCSQIFDDGTSVGINQTTNFNYTGLTVVGSTIPPATGTAKLAVNGVTMSLAYFATSDERMKKNIQNIPDALKKVKALEGKLYQWKIDENANSGMDKNIQIGFIAQDLARVLPESVVKKEDGTYAVNYNSIIPVLTEAIKEQQVSIEEMRNEIVNLRSEISNLKGQANKSKSEINYFTVSPNPFNSETKISYDLGTTVSKAICLIYDLQGKIIKQISIPANAVKGSVTFTKDNLSAGVYFVSFSINNKEMQTEKVIITN